MKKILSYLSLILLFCGNNFAQKQTQWDYFINKYPIEKIYLHTDRTFYQPGEQIWFKVYVTDAALNLKEALSEMATIELINPRGGVEKTFSIYIQNGEGAGSYRIPSEAPGGQYKLRAYTAWLRNFDEKDGYTKDLFVQKTQMPLLLMNLDFERKAYSAGDEIQANLEVKTQQNTPLENYPLTYSINIEGKTIQTSKARTNRNGKIALKAMLSKDIKSADGTMNIMIDYEGSTEAISRSIPLVLNNIGLQFFPEGGYLVNNVTSNLAFKATNEFGKPADITGEIRNENNDPVAFFSSTWMGLGSVRFTPSMVESYHAVITSPQGISKQYPLPQILKQGYAISISSQKKNTIWVDTHTPNDEPYFITITSGETMITEDFSRDLMSYAINLSKLPAGVARVTLIDRKGTEQCERLIYIGEHAPMNIKITPDKKEYLPGEEVKLDIETYDAENNPLPANLSLSVMDDKINAFADDRQDNILSWLLMSSDLKDKVEDASYYFNPEKEKAIQSIDYVLLTHGWRRFTWKDVNNPDITIKSLPNSTSYIGGTVRYKQSKTGIAADVWLISYGKEKTVTHLRTKPSGKFLFTNVDRSGKIQLVANAVNYDNKGIEIDTLSLDLRSLQKQIEEDKTIRAKARNGIILEGEKAVEKEEEKTKKETEIALTDDMETPRSGEESLSSVMVQEVSVGFGQAASKKDLTTSVAGVSGDELVATPVPASNLSEALAGRMSGVSVTTNEGSPDASTVVIVRGTSSITASADPLYIVDGMPVSGISDIPASVIESVDVLKDASATAIYGARGANGVIIISTKNIGNTRNPLPNYKNLGKKINQEPRFTSIIVQPINAVSGLRETYNPSNYKKTAGQTRSDFRRTLYWNPSIQTDSTGKASVKLYSSDAIGGFRAIAEGIGGNKPGHGENTFFTNLPFSITTKAPVYFCFGDRIELPITLKNQTDKLIKGTLINDDYGYNHYRRRFNLADNYTKEKGVEIAPHSTTSLYVPYLISNSYGSAYLYTSFRGSGAEDRVSQWIEVLPQGFPVKASFAAADSTATYRFNINKPLEGSMYGNFVMNLDILQQMILGSESIIREPNGCFEQTTSKLFIDAAALKYLQQRNIDGEKKTEKLLQEYIKKGYSKMFSYENPKGGFGWFGGSTGNVSLTAKCLMHLVEMKSFGIKGLDDNIIIRTKEFLLAHRDGKGGFIQEKNKYNYSLPSDVVTNAYTVYAMSEAGINGIEKEYNYAAEEAIKSKDIYRLALLTNTLYNYGEYIMGDRLLGELNTVVDKDNYERSKNSNTITYSWGYSYNVEVNALHLSALLKAKQTDNVRIEKAYNELMKSRSSYGFGSTQATLLALKALIDYDARYPVVINENAKVTISFNDNHTIERRISKKDFLIREDDLQQHMHEGENTVQISYTGLQNASYGINFGWTSLTPNSSSKCMVGLSTKIDNTNKKVGETARLTSIVENKTNSPLPMTIASIGIPAGAAPQHWQLKEIQEKAQADFVEIDKNFVVFYFVGMTPKEKRTINLDLRVETPGTFQAPASSAYLYYTDEYKVWNDGVKLKVTP